MTQTETGLPTGLSHPATYQALADLAAGVPADQAIVELGTYRGASACWLAAGAKAGEGAHVTTIDPHDLPGQRTTTGAGRRPAHPLDYTDPAIRAAAHQAADQAGLAEAITFVRGYSVEQGQTWAGPPVGLLFIDGDHREGAARRDITAWERHLVRGGVVAWDDYDRRRFPGVVSTVHRLVAKGLLSHPWLVGTLAITTVERA